MCNGVGVGVAAGLGGAPRRGSGQVGWGAQPGAFGAGSPGSAGAGRASSCRTEVTFSHHVQVTCGQRPRSCSPTSAASRRHPDGIPTACTRRSGWRAATASTSSRANAILPVWRGATAGPAPAGIPAGSAMATPRRFRRHPAITQPDRLGSVRGAVVLPRHTQHPLAGAFEQPVIDHDGARRSRRQQQIHDQIDQHQPTASAHQRAVAKNRCARACCQVRSRHAPSNIPHTVRRRVWAINQRPDR